VVHQVLLELLEQMVLKVLVEQQVHQELLEHQQLQVVVAQQVLQVLLVVVALLEHRVQMEQPVAVEVQVVVGLVAHLAVVE
jgi:hypothetical protein